MEHVGSTAVPGLAAKPIIDMVLVVVDSSDEDSYLADLEKAGYLLQIREPDWFEHRVFKGPAANINLHVFSVGCPEIERMLVFRDWLRSNDEDRFPPGPPGHRAVQANLTAASTRMARTRRLKTTELNRGPTRIPPTMAITIGTTAMADAIIRCRS